MSKVGMFRLRRSFTALHSGSAQHDIVLGVICDGGWITLPKLPWSAGDIKTVNLKSDRPSVHEALLRLEREIAQARQGGVTLLKFIHGYGSTGAGGDIRIAVQARLREMADSGAIRGCVFGEEWSKGCEAVWRLLQENSELKADKDLGRRNQGITVVML